MKTKDNIMSIEKCFAILDCMDSTTSLLTLEEIIQKTGYKKTTCFRMLKTMRSLGVIESAPGTKKYQFGPRLIIIGSSALKNMNLRQSALPILRRLRDETKETVNLTILSGAEVLFVDRIMSDYLVNTNINIGDRLPVYYSSMGKAILAFLSEERLKTILPLIEYEKKTKFTIVSEAALLQELNKIRVKGFSINDEEFEKGLRTVAAPIINYTGEAVAAINIAWLTVRHPGESTFTKFAEKVVIAAEQISKMMGDRTKL